jgi:outer membrane protein assembly factor BamB
MFRIALVLSAALTFAVAPGFAGENWPQFRGPNGEGITKETGLATTWSETENIVWKTPIVGKAWSSPVIWKDQIWVTNAPPDGKQLYAVCIDRNSGQIVYDIKVFEIAEPQFCYPLNSYASSTPVIEEGRAYVHFGAHGTACIDTTNGKVLWTRQDLECNHFRGPASSPILYGNLLVVAYDGYDFQYVVAFNKETGETVWKKDRNIEYGTDNGDMKKGYGTARVIDVDGIKQLVYPSAGATIAYVPESGEEIWRMNHGGMNACNTPLVGHGLLFLNSASGGFKLFAMRLGGTGDLTKTNVEWKTSQGVPSRPSTLLLDDLIFMVADNAVVTCLEAKTGKRVWNKRLEGEFSSSPIYSEGKIYFSNQDGQSFVVAASREYELLATNTLDAGCMASPAVYEKAIYLRTKEALYRIEKK